MTAIAAVLLTLLVQLLLARTSTNAVEQVLDDRADSVVSCDPGRLDRRARSSCPTRAWTPGVAVYDATGDLVAGSVPSSLAEVYADLRTADRAERDRRGRRLEPGPGRALRARRRGPRASSCVTERIRPYEQAEHCALLVSIVTGLLAVIASARPRRLGEPTRAASRCVDMAGTAAEWSEHDLGRRFDLGAPTNEITALGRDPRRAPRQGLGRDPLRAAAHLRAGPRAAHPAHRRPGHRRPGACCAPTSTSTCARTSRRSSTAPAGWPRRSAGCSSSRARRPAWSRRPPRGCAPPSSTSPAPYPVGRSSTSPSTTSPSACRGAWSCGRPAPWSRTPSASPQHVRVHLVEPGPASSRIAVDDDGPGVAPDERELIFEAGHTSRRPPRLRARPAPGPADRPQRRWRRRPGAPRGRQPLRHRAAAGLTAAAIRRRDVAG